MHLLWAADLSLAARGIPVDTPRPVFAFVFAGNAAHYLRVYPPVEELRNENSTGVDLRKFFADLGNANPYVFQGLAAPPVSEPLPGLRTKLLALSGGHFGPRGYAHTATERAAVLYQRRLAAQALRPAEILEVVVLVLEARWVVERQTPPPFLFNELTAQLAGNVAITHELNALLGASPTAPVPFPEGLQEFVTNTLQTCLMAAPNLPGARKQSTQLDRLFREIVGEMPA